MSKKVKNLFTEKSEYESSNDSIKSFKLGASSFLNSEDDIFVDKMSVPYNGTHSHDFVEIAFVSAGSGTHISGEVTESTFAGDFIIINPHVYHQFVSNEGDMLLVYNCIFNANVIDGSLNDNSNFISIVFRYLFHSIADCQNFDSFFKLNVGKHINISNIFEQMHAEYKAKNDGYKQVIKSYLITLLILVFRCYQTSSAQKKTEPLYKDLVVQSALRFIEEHFAEDIKSESLSNRAYFSKSYFSRIFKEVAGITYIQYLHKIRIQKACHMLEHTSLSITQICYDVGYCDTKYFYKLFASVHQMTPHQYRQLMNT